MSEASTTGALSMTETGRIARADFCADAGARQRFRKESIDFFKKSRIVSTLLMYQQRFRFFLTLSKISNGLMGVNKKGLVNSGVAGP